jgi:superfamily II DNA or RNA helicase
VPKIVKIEEVEYDGDVYNLHVQDNHNYVANGIIVSNCHQAKANVIAKLLNEHCAHIAHRFGMTGTLPKDKTDCMSIKASLGPVRFTYKSAELIEDGWLASLQIDVVQVKPDMRADHQKFIEKFNPTPRPTYKQFKRSYFPDWQAEKNYLQKDQKRLKYIADEIYGLSQKEKGNVLCLVNGVEVGKKLAQMIDGAIFVYGGDDVKERERVYKLFQTEDHIVVIATMHIAAVGLDIARIFNFCLLDFGKSFIKTIQAIGRGLRKAHDKDFVYIRDYCSDLKYGQKHMRDRIGYYTEQRYPYRVIERDLSELC